MLFYGMFPCRSGCIWFRTVGKTLRLFILTKGIKCIFSVNQKAAFYKYYKFFELLLSDWSKKEL